MSTITALSCANLLEFLQQVQTDVSGGTDYYKGDEFLQSFNLPMFTSSPMPKVDITNESGVTLPDDGSDEYLLYPKPYPVTFQQLLLDFQAAVAAGKTIKKTDVYRSTLRPYMAVNVIFNNYVAVLSASAETVAVGSTIQMSVSLTNAGDVETAAPTYSVDDETKATIDSAGVLTGVAGGTVTVTAAETGKYSVTKEITVVAA